VRDERGICFAQGRHSESRRATCAWHAADSTFNPNKSCLDAEIVKTFYRKFKALDCEAAYARQRKTRWLGAFVFSSQEDQATCGAAYVRVSTNWRGESAELDAILALSSKWSDNSSVKIMQMTRSAGHHCSCGSCHIAGISSNEGLSSEPRQGT